jgi:hypothetical protein
MRRWGIDTYHSLNTTVAQSKNYSVGVSTTTEIKNITTFDNNGI